MRAVPRRAPPHGTRVVAPAGTGAALLIGAVAGLVGEQVANGRRHRRELAEARRLARTDDLTGLANRRAFLESTNGALAAGTPVSVLLIDLDGFKAVNDTYGHVAGDQVLRVVAARLLQATGRRCVVARLGGDEFAVLVPGEVSRGRHGYTDRVRDALSRPVPVGPGTGHGHVTVDASVGATTRSPGDRAPTDRPRRADAAMYRAKTAQRVPPARSTRGKTRLVEAAGSSDPGRRW